MISISIFRINAKNRTIWYNLIQTSVPLVYTIISIILTVQTWADPEGGQGVPPPPLELPDYLFLPC